MNLMIRLPVSPSTSMLAFGTIAISADTGVIPAFCKASCTAAKTSTSQRISNSKLGKNLRRFQSHFQAIVQLVHQRCTEFSDFPRDDRLINRCQIDARNNGVMPSECSTPTEVTHPDHPDSRRMLGTQSIWRLGSPSRSVHRQDRGPAKSALQSFSREARSLLELCGRARQTPAAFRAHRRQTFTIGSLM